MVINLDVFDWLAAFSYGLIALSYAMRDIRWLRAITVAACTLDIFIYYYIGPGQPLWVQLVMSILFIGINAYPLYALWKEGREGNFAPESRRLFASVIGLLTRRTGYIERPQAIDQQGIQFVLAPAAAPRRLP